MLGKQNKPPFSFDFKNYRLKELFERHIFWGGFIFSYLGLRKSNNSEEKRYVLNQS